MVVFIEVQANFINMFSFKNNMNKRGQITLFVIIGVLIISAVILAVVFRPQLIGIAVSPEEAQRIVNTQLGPVQEFTESCMAFAARKTLNTMGRQGGYVIPRPSHISIPEVVPDAPVINYALYYDSERGYINELPSLNKLKEELITYVENNVDFVRCIDDYNNFEDILEVKAVNTLPVIDKENLDIGEDSGLIIIPYSYPVELSKGNATAFFEEAEVVIPINLARIREVAARITNDVAMGKNYMETINEEAAAEWEEARENPDSEKLFIRSEAYTILPTDLTGDTYNQKNLIFNIEYQNPALAITYQFYFLLGQP